jgi:hypothetical protein
VSRNQVKTLGTFFLIFVWRKSQQQLIDAVQLLRQGGRLDQTGPDADERLGVPVMKRHGIHHGEPF